MSNMSSEQRKSRLEREISLLKTCEDLLKVDYDEQKRTIAIATKSGKNFQIQLSANYPFERPFVYSNGFLCEQKQDWSCQSLLYKLVSDLNKDVSAKSADNNNINRPLITARRVLGSNPILVGSTALVEQKQNNIQEDVILYDIDGDVIMKIIN